MIGSCCLYAPGIQADPLSQSYSSWKVIGSDILVRYTISKREASRLLGESQGNSSGSESLVFENNLATSLGEHLRKNIGVSTADHDCFLLDVPQQRRSGAAYLIMELRFDCGKAKQQTSEDEPLTARIAALFNVAPSHIHFARFRVAEDHQLERLFTRQTQQREFNLASPADDPNEVQEAQSGIETLQSYLVLGFQHILEGIDHIAFLLALLLLSTRVKDVLLIVTGFTLGHSITLSLAVLDIVQPNIAMVESIIGLTIALVAIENIAVHSPSRRAIIACTTLALLFATLFAALDSRAMVAPSALAVFGLALFSLCYLWLSDSAAAARRYRPLVTLVFGLVHGFGFANVLQEVGLPDDRVLPALLGFNLGVEFGQIAIVLALWLLLLMISKLLHFVPHNSSGSAARYVPHGLLSACLCCLGVYWFVQRAYL